MVNEVPVKAALEMACAAQRVNKRYVKTTEYIFADDGKIMGQTWPNKFLMQFSLGLLSNLTPENTPDRLTVTDDDRALAEEIQRFFRRLMFSAVKGDNEFQTSVNSLLQSEQMPANSLGYIACLPSVFKTDYSRLQVEKKSKVVDDSYLGAIGDQVLDLDCEVLSCQRSKNFDAWNIDAIISNKMVSWMSKIELKLGPCVVVKAKIKDHAKHWKHGNSVTRLNYVKAAQ